MRAALYLCDRCQLGIVGDVRDPITHTRLGRMHYHCMQIAWKEENDDARTNRTSGSPTSRRRMASKKAIESAQSGALPSQDGCDIKGNESVRFESSGDSSGVGGDAQHNHAQRQCCDTGAEDSLVIQGDGVGIPEGSRNFLQQARRDSIQSWEDNNGGQDNSDLEWARESAD